MAEAIAMEATTAPSSRPSRSFSLSTTNRATFTWLFVVLGGLPFYLPILLYLGEQGLATTNPIYWYFWVNASISAPHVYSTYVRLSRKMSEGRVARWYGFPLYGLIFVALVAASKSGWFLETMTAVNLWQSVHYCRQVYGVSRFVARREDETARSRRLVFWSYHFAVPLFVLGRWDVLYTVWGGKASGAIIPVNVSSAIMVVCWILAGVGALAGLVVEISNIRKDRGKYNPIGLATLIAYFGIHIFGFLSVTFYQRGFFAVTIFHAVQYLSLVWLLEHSRSAGVRQRVLTAVPAAVSFPLFWLLLFGAGYALENYLFVGGSGLWPLLATVGLAAVSAHHYAVDTVMWRRAAGP